MLQCCKCGKQYEFVPYESDLTLPVIVCPYCGLRHTVTFEAVDDSSLIVPTELKLATRPPVLIASRILNASRVAQAADDTDVTGWKKANEFIVVFQLDEEKGPWTAAYKLQWKVAGGTYADLAATGAIKWGTVTDLVNGNAVVIGEKACTATGGAGSTWQDGWEVEGASISSSIELADECYTEIWFACNSGDAENGAQYYFQIYDATNSAVIAEAVATLTTAEITSSLFFLHG